ncbi:hypothetical protein O181_018485 [Austropuccinia psidii MF-1]|uniref:Uncharacterized protein n=1 Tax=Austropuccinia psidii MF-1 TaxID=1389203 RepID=A0A9Q3C9Y0_9BASI|nr:hypothetical protein [Austropuccinia psidii MF-1]
MLTNLQRPRKKGYGIEKFLEEENKEGDYESYSIVNAIRKNSYDDQDPIEEFLMEYPEEKQLEIQYTQLEEGLPQDTANKTLCKQTQDTQTLIVTPTKGM